MEPGCKLEDFGRLAQPAATNRLRCRVNVVSERYLDETQHVSLRCEVQNMFVLCLANRLCLFSGLRWWQFCFCSSSYQSVFGAFSALVLGYWLVCVVLNLLQA